MGSSDPFDRNIRSCYLCRIVWSPGDDGETVRLCPQCKNPTFPVHPESLRN